MDEDDITDGCSLRQCYPSDEGQYRYWSSEYLFQINDTKAAEIRAAGKIQPTEEGNPFTDMPKDAYYHDAVLWAVDKDITTGTGDGTTSLPI